MNTSQQARAAGLGAWQERAEQEVPSPADYAPQVFAHCIRCGAFTEIIDRGVCWHCIEHHAEPQPPENYEPETW